MIQLILPIFKEEDLPGLYYKPNIKSKDYKSYKFAWMTREQRMDVKRLHPLWFSDNQLRLPKIKRNHKSGARMRAKKKILFNGKEKAECFYCKKLLTFKAATLDHIIPWGSGGGNAITNLLIACDKCNNERDSMPFDRWMLKIGLPVPAVTNS